MPRNLQILSWPFDRLVTATVGYISATVLDRVNLVNLGIDRRGGTSVRSARCVDTGALFQYLIFSHGSLVWA